MKRHQAALGLAMLLLAYSAGTAIAEEQAPDPDPEVQGDEPPGDEQPPNEEPVTDTAAEEGHGDEPQADDSGHDDNADEKQANDSATVVEDMNDDWAEDVVENESDDAIPVDRELDPSGENWDVIEFANDGDHQEDAPDTSTDGMRDPEDIPTIRRPVKGAKPQRPATPGTAGNQDTPYSTGGKPIRADGAPWQAQIYYPREAPQWAAKVKSGTPLWQLQHFCGGALIANDWVLTAAHCIDEDMVKSGYRVRLGASDISKNEGLNYKIDRIVRHSQYGDKKAPAPPPNMYANDIALIHIVDDTNAGARDPVRIHPIPLFDGKVTPGAEVTGTGWGKTAEVTGHVPSAILMKVDLRAMDTETCKNRPDYGPERISGKVICASNPHRSTCQGDSGGALTFTNGAPKVVGIVSWGKLRCSGDGQPGVYTRIENYRDWIKQAMLLDPSKDALP